MPKQKKTQSKLGGSLSPMSPDIFVTYVPGRSFSALEAGASCSLLDDYSKVPLKPEVQHRSFAIELSLNDDITTAQPATSKRQ
jgi:hypothetical protein